MKVKIFRIPFSYFHAKGIQFEIKEQGYLDLNGKFSAEECWHLTNWSCWTDEKPTNLFSDIECSNSDIIFHDTEKDEYHLALPLGWMILDSLDEIKEFCENYHN